MPTSVDGLISGLSTSSTITQLMNVERQSQTRLSAKKTSNDSLVGIYQALNSRMLALKEVGAGLRATAGWQVTKATSSDATLATATATSTAQAGSLTFRIDRLAVSDSMVSGGVVSSTEEVIATPNSHFLVSAWICAANCSGVFPTGTAPCAISFSFTAGLESEWEISC